jgi:hypothetical protein
MPDMIDRNRLYYRSSSLRAREELEGRSMFRYITASCILDHDNASQYSK